MNITLLILGVFLILISTILIAINSSNLKDENSKHQIKEEPPIKGIVNKKEDEVIPIKYVTNVEEAILFRDIKKEEPQETVDLNEKPINITDEIIYLHKEGLSVAQIAARLEKGIREIEIILKVNKLKD